MCILFFVLCYKFIAKNGGLINLKKFPVVYVDYPGSMSLTQIYGTFNRAMLQVASNLRAYSDLLILMLYGRIFAMSRVREREENF